MSDELVTIGQELAEISAVPRPPRELRRWTALALISSSNCLISVAVGSSRVRGPHLARMRFQYEPQVLAVPGETAFSTSWM
ncbi:hypothetical protein [Actinophytocola sp. NPDC049390]|uniref:hypothetical protein n=1 Tax=Actinophytocola sp. NPDC049390 TaxID=3363894 RepID=UPI0037ACAA63